MIKYLRPAILSRIPSGGHAVIEANAGTGKTHTIEHLVLELILNSHSPIDEILVMTFTEKATAELRSRIRALLENVLSGSPPPDHPGDWQIVELEEEAERRVESALFAFDRAPIFTIHGFCSRVLTDLAFETRSSFENELVDGRRAFHDAFRAELREHFAVDPDSLALLDDWLSQQDSAARENSIVQMEKLLWEAHFHRYLAADGPQRNLRALTDLALQFDTRRLAKAYSGVRHAADAGAIVDEVESIIARTQSADALRGALAKSAFSLLPQTEKVLNGAKRALPAETRALLDVIDQVRVALSLEVRIVDAFLPRISQRLTRDKRDHGRIDYADMLQWVWDALDGPGGETAASALRQRYRCGIIDEFQDTDDLQWRIFRRIFLESASRNLLYVVGDPKQAIYSFRGADVYTYLAAREEMITRGAKTIPLTENFRSTGDLIRTLNHILAQNAQPAVFSSAIKYEHPVTCGRPDLRALDARGQSIAPVSLLRLRPGRRGPISTPRMRVMLGRQIASEIRRIISAPDGAIALEENGKSRRLEARDIFILTRSGSESAEIGGYLREAGVPFAFYKQAGLFQTAEAYHVLDLLRAIEEPDSQSRRLRAWVSPFFAVPYKNLFGRTEAPAGHPLNERLYEWKALAGEERFAELFDRLVDETGLAGRELFEANSERELTNYLHLFEILLEVALSERLSLGELIARLDSFISGLALPGGLESDVQRLESERSAVQIMSIHMSKGLQAAVVFLFGGTAKPVDWSKVWVSHDDEYRRRVVIGKTAKAFEADRLKREECEENERLAYVAMTRARAKLYLPVYLDGALKTKLNGYYTPLNHRLCGVLDEIHGQANKPTLFEIIELHDPSYEPDSASKLSSLLKSWSPPATLLSDDRDSAGEQRFMSLRERHSPLITRSYTSLGSRPRQDREIEPEEFKYDVDSSAETADLRGGRSVGIFLHEVIEKLNTKSLEETPNLAGWRKRDEIVDLFTETMRRHHVTDPRWLERGTEVVFNALCSSIASPGRALGPLYRCPNVREMEFVYPIPESAHPLFQSSRDGAWTVERGYLKGFVDFVFEQHGLYYFADWKSDLLDSYAPAAVATHVAEHYGLQARIYSVGIVRLLRIRSERDYRARFGGLLYLFIRGMRADGSGADGVYFHRPEWDEIAGYERSLMEIAPAAQSRG